MQSDLIASLQRHIEQVDSMAPSLEEMLARYQAEGGEAGGDLAIPARSTSPGNRNGQDSDHVIASTECSEPELCERSGAESTVFGVRGHDESPALKPPKRRALALAVAAAILLVVGAVVVDGNNRTVVTDAASSPSVNDAASSPEAADPVASPGEVDSIPPPTLVDALGYGWSRIPDDWGALGDSVPFTRGMTDVTVGGPGLVAVGESDEGTAVWTSRDGTAWSRAPHDEDVFGGGDRMQGVTAGGPGLVAVGGPGDFAERDGSAAVWTSVDGVIWSRVPDDEAVFGGEGVQRMESVVAGGPGLVAVGWDASSGAPDAAVWTSVDGITWSRVADDELVFGGDGEQTMESVTVGGPGLVAVGSDGVDDGVDRGDLSFWKRDFLGNAAVWTSVDGLTWSRVPHDDTVLGGEGNQWMSDVTTTGLRLVAVGGDWERDRHGAGAAAVWTSVDGITWSRVPHDDTVFSGENDQAMNSVTSSGSGLVAVGRAWAQSGANHSDGSDDSAASVWTSVDGITWSWLGYDEAVFGSDDNSSYLLSDGPVLTEGRQYLNSVLVADTGLVAVGADWSGPSHGAAVWVAMLEG